MTRAEQIRELQARYLLAVDQRKHKAASIIYARLKSLTTRQLKAEIRQERRKAA